MLHIIIHRKQIFLSVQAHDRHFRLGNHLMASRAIFHSWNMLTERAVKNELADCEETPPEISACITPTRGIISQLATKSKEMGIHNIPNNPMKSVPNTLGKN